MKLLTTSIAEMRRNRLLHFHVMNLENHFIHES
jgi:hypothetical protein